MVLFRRNRSEKLDVLSGVLRTGFYTFLHMTYLPPSWCYTTYLPPSSAEMATPEYRSTPKGLRVVTPYRHEHRVVVKRRWVGRQLIDVFTTEFHSFPESYYRAAIKSGLIAVNSVPCDPSTVLGEGDAISHVLHRHEPPVAGGRLNLVAVSDSCVVVDKPASLHSHPCGAFTFNNVISILEHDTPGFTCMGGGKLYPVHRLDRLVSGILLLARSSAAAAALSSEIQDGRVQKTYVARVKGSFASSGNLAATISSDDDLASISSDAGDKAFFFSCPTMLSKTARNGKQCCSPEGKQATTRFQLIATNGYHSLVNCRPMTGRTHQIRLHLQRLGYPIINDPLYGPESDVRDFRPAADQEKKSKAAEGDDGETDTTRATECAEEASFGRCSNIPEKKSECELSLMKKLCRCCQSGDDAAFSVDQLRHEGICLHALRYSGPEWQYETALPDWAHMTTVKGAVGSKRPDFES